MKIVYNFQDYRVFIMITLFVRLCVRVEVLHTCEKHLHEGVWGIQYREGERESSRFEG
jgi:hypothetical protein